MEPLSLAVSAGNRCYIQTGCFEECLTKALFTRVGGGTVKDWCYLGWGNRKGLVLPGDGSIGLGVITGLRPEEERELGSRAMVGRGPPYKNVALVGVCIPWYRLPPCL